MKNLFSSIIISFILLFFSNIASAETQEWFDKSHNFSKERKVFIVLNIPNELRNGIKENETFEIFTEKLQKKIIEELPTNNYSFKMFNEVATDIKKSTGIILQELYSTNPQKAQSILVSHLQSNFDMYITTNILVYDTGTEYQEGYFYTAPSLQTSLVTTPYGSATVTTHGTQQQYAPGGNVRMAYACVKFEVYDIETGKLIWSKIDDRAKAVTKLRNTQPKDLYGRILNSFFDDLKEKITKPNT